MIPKTPIPVALSQLALAQAGALTVEQCRLLGFPRAAVRRLVAEGTWQSAGRGLLVTIPGPWSRATRCWLASLAGGATAALSHGTAAELAGWRSSRDEAVHLLLPLGSTSPQKGPWTVHWTRRPFSTVGALPRTTVERTALDLCREAPDEAIGIITEAVNSRQTTPGRIRRELEGFQRFPRRALLMALLDDVGEGALSHLEVLYLRHVERDHGLPTGRRQTSSRVGIRDVDYGGLLVELDGRQGHTGRGAFRDMTRDNVHLLRGEQTMRFGLWDVDHRPCGVAAMVAAGLRMVGHQIDPVTCWRGCREEWALADIA